ncbi:MAG: uroporphyrinogen-III synthase [Calditrichaeota bacterium]|nr:uroporphyrinogen-III synthase [Calditrichota bacterium]
MPIDVLLTRNNDRVADLVNKLGNLGISSAAIPLTESVPIMHFESLVNPSKYRVVAFSSVIAVNIVADTCKENGFEFSESCIFASVGSATAEAVRTRFSREVICPKTPDGVSLAHLVYETIGDQEAGGVIWLGAESPSGGFFETSETLGLNVKKIPIYRTVDRKADLLNRELNKVHPWKAVFFAAPSQVRAYVRLVDFECWENAVAIGKTTGAELSRLGFFNYVISKSPKAGDVADAIVKMLENMCNSPQSVLSSERIMDKGELNR